MSFFGWSEDYVKRANGAQMWVWYDYAKENQAGLWGNNLVRSDGFNSFPEQEFEMIKKRFKKP
jgi:hypothetical protein